MSPRRAGWLAVFPLGLALFSSACAIEADEAPANAPEAGAERPAPLPGAAPIAAELAERLWTAYRAKGEGYRPRTEHLRGDGAPLYVNRLILEDSPYLAQHAHNPVDWYPWGPEAFAKARREDKPIFLSIGYSTCHWCHVMEEESFDDEEVARRLNEGFVAIKVDREQHPEVDEVYMTAVQLTAGRGGWPMSSLLTPEGDPFFGGTYFPRRSFLELLSQAAEAWRAQRPQLEARARQVADAVARVSAVSGEAAALGSEAIEAGVGEVLESHDAELGGFSPAPKFPHEPDLLFLLERARRGDRRALAAVETTLEHMARGGIYDQVGGGFHRYSTDARWLVPHFEKMLYNQAHLARAYLEAFELTGEPFYERVARQTLDYVLRDMTSPAGAFYSATDADREGREGAFFVWTPEGLRAALPADDAELALRVFGVTEAGNFEGESILFLPAPLATVAAEMEVPLERLLERLDRIRGRLYAAREQRPQPLRDEKVVTAWNGMTITTLARAGELLGEERYLEAARRAADFLWRHARRREGEGGGALLWRIHLEGRSSVAANLGDYAYLAEALTALYDTYPLGDEEGARWLERARALAETMLERFWDAEAGGFFLSEDDHGGRLPVRPRSTNDGAIPAPGSVAARALVLLAERTGESAYRRRAEAALAALSSQVERRPSAFPYLLLAADALLHGAAGGREYGAGGALRVTASWNESGGDERRLTVALELAEGWHVNADEPLQEELIATRLELEDGGAAALAEVSYPEPETVTLGFQQEPLAVYRGRARIEARLAGDPGRLVRLGLRVQACDDQRCLRPETLRLELPAAERP